MVSPEEMAASMVANMPEKTGKALQEWLAIVAESSAGKHGEIVKMLKADHGMSHGFANLVAHKHKLTASDSAPLHDPVAAQYDGAKQALRPIYDAVIAFAQSLGDDVELAPKKANVSLRRAKQFALAQPSTKTRFDLFVQLKGDPPAGRLQAGNAMCSHKIALETPEDFDAEVQNWLREAYQRAG